MGIATPDKIQGEYCNEYLNKKRVLQYKNSFENNS